MEKIEGKVALITGGSKGIGYGVAQSLVKEGMRVAITGRTKSVMEAADNLKVIEPVLPNICCARRL